MGALRLSDNAKEVLTARYLRRNSEGEITETPEELFAAVARAVAHAELQLGTARQAAFWEDRYLQLLTSLDFLPNSPTLMNAGKPLGQLSGCFVLPVEDSIEAIFEAIEDMALVQRSGGGTGMSFSHLRPKDDFITTTPGKASGPVSFSKTINLPQSADVDDVKDAYRQAWELGLKGVTIFRYGSKSQQVLSLGAGEKSYNYDHASQCDRGECEV